MLSSLRYHQAVDEIDSALFYEKISVMRSNVQGIQAIESKNAMKDFLMNAFIVLLLIILGSELTYLYFVFEVKLNHLPEK